MKKLLLLLPFIILLSCNSANERANKITEEYLAEYSNDISEEELDLLTDDISSYFESNETDKIKELFDLKACFYRGHIENNGPSEVIESMDQNIVGVSEKIGIFKDFNQNFERIDLVKRYTSEKEEHIIVYRGFGEGGVNYMELLLGKRESKIQILDVYMATSFEYISTTMYEVIKNISPQNFDQEDLTKIEKSKSEFQMGQYDASLSTLHSLRSDSPYRGTKAFDLFEIYIYAEIDNEKYLEKLEFMQSKYVDIPGINLLLVDFYLLQEDYNNALESIEEIKNRYPDDHLINLIIGNIYSMMEDYTSAIYYYNLSLQHYPEMIEINDYLLSAYMSSGDRINVFKVIDQLLDAEYSTVESIEIFLMSSAPDYENWPEYKEWKKSI